MKSVFTLFIVFITFTKIGYCQQPVSETKIDNLQALYFDNYPFSYKNKNGQIEGIEVDILKSFADWMKNEKAININIEYKSLKDFSAFFQSVANGQSNYIGLGSVSITEERKKQVAFAPPYLKNNSILVSQLEVPTLRKFEDFELNFSDKIAVVIKGTSHEKELLEIKEKYFPKMRVKYVDSPRAQLQLIFEDKTYFGYVDLLSYWTFLQERCCVLKIHREVSTKSEYFGFILPLNSTYQNYLLEFFEGGFGFTSTEAYKKILEKYLGYEVISSVELF